jgi:hypothetical protein
MLVEKEVVVTPVDDSSTCTGLVILVALIALAIACTAWYFMAAQKNNSNQYIERTTETHDVTPVTVPQPVSVPQPVAVPVPQSSAPAPAAQPAPAAPSSQSSTENDSQ